MRHARRNQRLSRPSAHRKSLLSNLAKQVLRHGRIRTTVAKAKESQRVVDRLITWGKDGSVHSRRLAYRILQDQILVKQLFGDVAPRFLDCQGGYTRVLRLSPRLGDGAKQALLELTRLPAATPKRAPAAAAHAPAPKPGTPPKTTPEVESDESKKSGTFFEGLRKLFRPKKGAADT